MNPMAEALFLSGVLLIISPIIRFALKQRKVGNILLALTLVSVLYTAGSIWSSDLIIRVGIDGSTVPVESGPPLTAELTNSGTCLSIYKKTGPLWISGGRLDNESSTWIRNGLANCYPNRANQLTVPLPEKTREGEWAVCDTSTCWLLRAAS